MLVFNLGVCFVVGLNGQNTHYYAFYITACSVQRIFLFTPSPFQRKLVRKDTTLRIASFQLYPASTLNISCDGSANSRWDGNSVLWIRVQSSTEGSAFEPAFGAWFAGQIRPFSVVESGGNHSVVHDDLQHHDQRVR